MNNRGRNEIVDAESPTLMNNRGRDEIVDAGSPMQILLFSSQYLSYFWTSLSHEIIKTF